MANEFIWHLPTEAQQAMSYAANAAQADLKKQENTFRLAELGLRRQQQQETAQLNRLLTENQIQQHRLDRESQERLSDARNKNYLEGLRIQFPEGRTTPEAQRQTYDAELRQQEELQEAGLAQQLETALADLDKRIATASPLEKAPKQLEGQRVSLGDVARIAMNPIYGMSQLDYTGRRTVREYLAKQLQRDPSDAEVDQFIKDTKAYRASPDTEHLSSLQQRKTALMATLTQYGWIYDPATKKIIRPRSAAIPTAGQLQGAPAAPPANVGLLTTPASLANSVPPIAAIAASALTPGPTNVGVNAPPAAVMGTNVPLLQRRYTAYLQRLAQRAPNRVPTLQDKLWARAMAEADVPQ